MLLETFPKDGIELVHLDAKLARRFDELQQITLRKAFLLVWYLLRMVVLRAGRRFDGLVVTPCLYHAAFLKDSTIIWMGALLRFRTIIGWLHLDGKCLRLEEMGRWHRVFVETTLNRCTHFICVSKSLESSFPPSIFRGKISTIENGIPDFAAGCRERGNPRALKRLIFLGAMRGEKGWEVLFEAAEEVCQRNSDCEFVFYGPITASDSNAVHSRFDGARYPRRIRYEGSVRAGGEKARVFQEADVLCLPSLNEALPLTMLEGFAAGLPVVASDVGGISDALDHGRGGYLCRPGDVRHLKEAILKVLADSERMRVMGEFNRQIYEAAYSKEAYGERWSRFFSELGLGGG